MIQCGCTVWEEIIHWLYRLLGKLFHGHGSKIMSIFLKKWNKFTTDLNYCANLQSIENKNIVLFSMSSNNINTITQIDIMSIPLCCIYLMYSVFSTYIFFYYIMCTFCAFDQIWFFFYIRNSVRARKWTKVENNLRDDFNFLIVNFPIYMCSPFQQHLYMEYISFSVDTKFQSLWFLYNASLIEGWC